MRRIIVLLLASLLAALLSMVPASAAPIRDVRGHARTGARPARSAGTLLASRPSSGSGGVQADFNGDGNDDLAIGSPGSKGGSGVVNVIYGSPVTGLAVPGNQLWRQQGGGSSPQPGDNFGASLAAGDFNGDGYADLAVGVPFEDRVTPLVVDAGAVNVFYGSSTGLQNVSPAVQYFHENTPGIAGGPAQAAAQFGFVVAAGNFNADSNPSTGLGLDDLAIGQPYRDTVNSFGSNADAGTTVILNGSSAGLTVTGSLVLDQDAPCAPGAGRPNDHLGWSLAAGNFNDDTISGIGLDDLAIGVPGEQSLSQPGAGALNVFYGSVGGLSGCGTPAGSLFRQEVGGMLGTAGAGDAFAYALAAGDINGDGADDLAVGVPFEDEMLYPPPSTIVVDAGVIQVIFGSTTAGLTSSGNQYSQQNGLSFGSVSSVGDGFGFSLTAGDFDGDGFQDLAVGVPFEDDVAAIVPDAGAVNAINGSATGLTTNGVYLEENVPGVCTAPANSDNFGYVASGDFNGDGYADLAVGVPLKEVSGHTDAGIVHAIYGSVTGLTATGNQCWSKDTPGILDVASNNDHFGVAMAA